MCGDGREGGREGGLVGDEREPEPSRDLGLVWAATAGTESWGEGCTRDGVFLRSAPLPASMLLSTSTRCCEPLPAPACHLEAG